MKFRHRKLKFFKMESLKKNKNRTHKHNKNKTKRYKIIQSQKQRKKNWAENMFSKQCKKKTKPESKQNRNKIHTKYITYRHTE